MTFSWIAEIPLSLQPPYTHIKHTHVDAHTLHLYLTNPSCSEPPDLYYYNIPQITTSYAKPLPFSSEPYCSSLVLISLISGEFNQKVYFLS